jgi:DNA-binding GntR family transcriptional regulator
MSNAAQSSLSARAYAFIRHRILCGELALGECISRRKIGVELSMSLLPVMEAMLRLEVEGLLESRPRSGTRVRIPTQEDVQSQFIIRNVLETESIRLFNQNATRKERSSLEKLAVRVDAAFKTDPLHFVSLHRRFHRRIVECTNYPALLKVLENTQALWSTWLCALVPRLPDHAIRERSHQELMEALNRGTPQEAAEKMREHVAFGFRLIQDGLEPYFQLRKINGNTYSRTAPIQG